MCVCDPSKPTALGQGEAEAACDMRHAQGMLGRQLSSTEGNSANALHREDP